jgi:hypothetical protein
MPGGDVVAGFGETIGQVLGQRTGLLSLCLAAGDVFAVGGTDDGRRQGVKGDAGLRFTFG